MNYTRIGKSIIAEPDGKFKSFFVTCQEKFFLARQKASGSLHCRRPLFYSSFRGTEVITGVPSRFSRGVKPPA